MNIVLRFGLYFTVGYSLMTLVVFLLQRKMIYFPDRSFPPADFVSDAGLKFWPGEGKDFRGYANAKAPAAMAGTVIVFHGNAGAAWHRDYFVHALQPLGYRVILAEYPGYGGRDGKISERSFVNDARAIVRRAHADGGGPIYMLGESLGCGIVSAVAGNSPVPVAGLILITPWDCLSDLAQTLYWYLPARWLTRDRFDNVTHLRGFDQPVAMAIAKQDRIVPNKHSLRLFESLTAQKKLWQFENADHNSWPTRPAATWWREVMGFVSKKSGGSNVDP